MSERNIPLGILGVILFVPATIGWGFCWMIGLLARTCRDGFMSGWDGFWHSKEARDAD